jgi:HK97 family phage portal protein
MAWNTSKNKSLNNADSKELGPGGLIANNPNYAGRAYRDSWDIERAYREGMQKITWVARCIDAIAGNQARLPIILRKDNSPSGEMVTGRAAKYSSLLEVLNTKSNIGENSFIFRYRLSAQLLLGTRGVFIEKVRGRDGRIVGLNLLPPQSTAPIPHPKKFVSGYEVQMPYGQKIIMKPEDVVWIRRPHPIDPYLSLTPLESAGVAIEIENLAKIYNRNYLMNDGRPGGLLVLRGEIDDDDKEELRSRFRGNIARAGYTSVISADDGVDYVDTSASPRDVAYAQLRQITKEEILAAFGVPETVIGNAAGRTFSNAAEEIRVFWMETMLPHLEPLARSLDELDDVYYVDFDLSEVPILQLYKQERERYLMQEFQSGLISNNEYRIGSGRKETDSDLADSLLMNPNLIPIANTKKKMEENPSVEMGGQPGMPGMPGAPGAPGMPGMPGMPGAPAAPGQEPIPTVPAPGGEQLDPNTMQGALAQAGAGEEQQAPAEPAMEPQAEGELPPDAVAQSPLPQEAVPFINKGNEPSSQIMYKSEQESSLSIEEQSLARWEEILNRSIERVLERQQRVVLEKASGVKAKKALFAGTLDVESILSPEVWDKQMDEDIRPVVSAIIQDAYDVKNNAYGSKSSKPVKKINHSDLNAQIDSQMQRIKSLNQENRETMSQMMFNSLAVSGEEERAASFRSAVVGLYANLMAKQRFDMAEEEARRAWKFGTYL